MVFGALQLWVLLINRYALRLWMQQAAMCATLFVEKVVAALKSRKILARIILAQRI
jgi:hypothetical protein